MAFKPKGRTIHEVHVPTWDGGSVKRTTGTRHAGTARAMHALVRELGPRGRRRRALIDAITAKPPRLSLAEVYDAHQQGGWAGLDALEARLSDVDLAPLVDVWHAEQTSRLTSSWPSIARTRVRTLVPEGAPFTRGELTTARVSAWLAGLTAVGQTTRAHYKTALRAFVTWLIARGTLTEDPLTRVAAYRIGAGRMVYLEPEAERAFVAALPVEWQTFGALLHAGAELGAALAVRARDAYDLVHEEPHGLAVRAPGTKAHNRDRVLFLDAWQAAYVRTATDGARADVRLAPDGPTPLAREQAARAAWRKAVKRCAAVGVPAGYRMHDARHTYAVNALRDGLTIEAVARQLGHRDGRLVLERYGRFVVRAADYARRSRASSRTNPAGVGSAGEP